ncbi:uncharacterized protein LOC126668723 [Mercurialis annua]|uniref:uncharacterized protein LOC126668723 n=1 Tax=Mercurialis annua TaxID=3986 RepID=UPI00215E3491|nr:uncharacterized protein LOC126668723 [Mercurialis annua]
MSQIEVEGEQPVIPTAPPAISSLSTPNSFGVTAAASLPPSSFSPAAAVLPSSSSLAATLLPSSSSPTVMEPQIAAPSSSLPVAAALSSPAVSFPPAAASSLAAAASSFPSPATAPSPYGLTAPTSGVSFLAASTAFSQQQLGGDGGPVADPSTAAADGGLPTNLVADPASLSRVSPSLAVSASGLPTNLVAEIVATTPAFSSETPTSGLAISKATTSGFPPTNTSGKFLLTLFLEVGGMAETRA